MSTWILVIVVRVVHPMMGGAAVDIHRIEGFTKESCEAAKDQFKRMRNTKATCVNKS